MAKKTSRELVIDASIARASGPPHGTHPCSRICREVLKAVLSVCHRIVLTRHIRDEWMTHQSAFARDWFVEMQARRKVVLKGDGVQDDLRHSVIAVSGSEKKRRAMLKDIILIEAAYQADRTVLSLDDYVRRCYGSCAEQVALLREIIWLNPVHAEHNVCEWLMRGAKNHARLRLGRLD